MISELIGELIDNADLYTKELHDLMYKAADTIEMLSEKARGQEWILCEEKLPEADGLYLATFALIGIPKFSNVESFKNGKWEYHNGYIIAWQPLPEPWKGVNDDISESY